MSASLAAGRSLLRRAPAWASRSPGLLASMALPMSQSFPGPLQESPCPGANLPMGARGFSKYRRIGFWARGTDGLHTTDDPRIFRPLPRRKYPYYKQRRFSKPYIAKDFALTAPTGAAVRLAIVYSDWAPSLIPKYYAVMRALQAAMPGAQIVLEHNQTWRETTNTGIGVLRVNEQENLELYSGEVDALFQLLKTPHKFKEKLVVGALDNFNWRYAAQQPAS